LAGAAITAGMQGARILGRRIWNSITGKENPSVNKAIIGNTIWRVQPAAANECGQIVHMHKSENWCWNWNHGRQIRLYNVLAADLKTVRNFLKFY
jgi:hypothetical protein